MADKNAAIEQIILDRVYRKETPLATDAAVKRAKYVSAILNSNMGRLFLLRAKNIPIPKISAKEQRPFVRLVDKALEAKVADPNADTNNIDEEINCLVYDLYGLTEEEITTMERSLGLIHASDKEEDAALLLAMLEVNIEDRVSREEVMEILLAPDEC